MEANIVDLRYKMKDVLRALARNEKVSVKYRGKIKGTITPESHGNGNDIRKHPIFGMIKQDTKPVEQVMDKLRGSRY